MKTLLLLGGKSRRFWPLQEKPLFPICGKTLLQHQMDRLSEAGCDDVVLVGSMENIEDIQTLYPDAQTVIQEEHTGMHGALLSALPACNNESVLIVGGNDVIESSAYEDLRNIIQNNDIQGALLAQRVDRYFPGGYLELEGDRIVGIQEKPGEGNEPSDLVNIVAHVHKDAAVLLEAIRQIDPQHDDAYEQALANLFREYEYHAVPYEGTWQAVKYPWHLLHLLPIFLDEIEEQSIHPTAEIHESAVIIGNVVIEEGVKVMPHATVRGPCYIGKNVVVANNALVRNASIGDGCIVGYSTEVKGSILAGSVWTHMNYLGDSVIGSNVSFGGGSTTGNLRLDEGEVSSVVGDDKVPTGLEKFGCIIGNDCRFGIQVGTNPGVKVGSGSFVGSQVLIDQDIPEQSFVILRDGKVEIRENKGSTPEQEEREKYRSQL